GGHLVPTRSTMHAQRGHGVPTLRTVILNAAALAKDESLRTLLPCHPERSEGSQPSTPESASSMSKTTTSQGPMKRIFLTGASSGLGAALARRYAQEGAMLGLVARRASMLEALRANLPHPERHRVYALDVTDHAALAAAAADFIAAAGGADVVI